MSYENIKEWAKMPLKQRYNLLIGVIIVALCWVIIHYEKKVNRNNEQYRTTINSIVTRYRGDKAALEAKLEVCNQNYLLYLQESEKEYKELLFEAKKLKETIDENIK